MYEYIRVPPPPGGATSVSTRQYKKLEYYSTHEPIQEYSSGVAGVPGQSENKLTFFLILSLFYRSQMVNFKENITFQCSGGGPTFSKGGGSNFFKGEGPIAYSL